MCSYSDKPWTPPVNGERRYLAYAWNQYRLSPITSEAYWGKPVPTEKELQEVMEKLAEIKNDPLVNLITRHLYDEVEEKAFIDKIEIEKDFTEGIALRKSAETVLHDDLEGYDPMMGTLGRYERDCFVDSYPPGFYSPVHIPREWQIPEETVEPRKFKSSSLIKKRKEGDIE